MAGSTVDRPNSTKGQAAGAEGSSNRRQWTETTHGSQTFRTDNSRGLESLQVRTKIEIPTVADDANKLTLVSLSPAIISTLSGLQDGHLAITTSAVYAQRYGYGTYLEKARVSLIGWKDATAEQRQAYEADNENARERSIATAQRRVGGVSLRISRP
jgi:hypothetical protein